MLLCDIYDFELYSRVYCLVLLGYFVIFRVILFDVVKALVRLDTGKRLTNRLPKLSLVTPWNGGTFRSRPDIRVDVSPTRGSNLWGPTEYFSGLTWGSSTFL